MRANEFEMRYRDSANDKYLQANLSDTRKPRLTLRQLNKLKKMRAAQDLENHIRTDTLEIIYGSPEEQSGMGIGGL